MRVKGTYIRTYIYIHAQSYVRMHLHTYNIMIHRRELTRSLVEACSAGPRALLSV